MKFSCTLTPAESKRLIAKGIIKSPEFLKAWSDAYVILLSGTTNGFIAQELGYQYKPEKCSAGVSSRRILCVTDPDDREQFPLVFYKGKPVEKTLQEALQDFHKDTIIIKGANALDPEGDVGVITSGFDGGNVAKFIGTVTSQGLKVIFAVGLEKMVASVKNAVKNTGAKTIDHPLGADFGMYFFPNPLKVTEVEALNILANVDAVHVASGGFGGNEGAVHLIGTGDKEDVEKALSLLESIKGEKPLPPFKGKCTTSCRYNRCPYYGKSDEELPGWLRS